jgi:predicted dehydrogenase
VIRAAFVGAGDVARKYYAPMLAPSIELAGVTDVDPVRAATFAGDFGGRAYTSLDELLADDDVDVVVVLSTHDTHEDVARRSLHAGKHVFSEKPLALTYAGARSLVELAREEGVRLGAAPSTFLGEAQQTARAVLREGRLGTVRLAYAEVNWGRIESWHPAPQPFYGVGALFDVGVYPLTVLASLLGPARRARGFGTVLMAERETLGGDAFEVETPDFGVAFVEFGDVLVRLTSNFYVGHHSRQRGLEIHGDAASLIVSWYEFDTPVEIAPFNGEWEQVPFVADPYPGAEIARGLNDMAAAIVEDRPHLATGDQAAHVVEIMCAIAESWRAGGAWMDVDSKV